MSLFSSKRLRFYPLLEFCGSGSTDNSNAALSEGSLIHPFVLEKSISSASLPHSLNSTQDSDNCWTPAAHLSKSCLRIDSPNIGDPSRLFQMLEASSFPEEVTLHDASHCSSRPLEWDHGWHDGEKDVQFETSIDSIWTWPTCQRACAPVIIDRPMQERRPTPPPSPLPWPTPSQVYSRRRKTPVPQFLHSAELAHDHGKLAVVQCNNHSLSSSRVDLSTQELCEAVTRAEMWTQRSMRGLREHARSLLAATEAEERRLRARLASLQSQMMMAVETERSEESSESTSISDNPAVEGRKGDQRPQEQIEEVATNVDFNTSAAAPQFNRHRRGNAYATNESFFAKGDLNLTSQASLDLGNAGDIAIKESTAVGEGDASLDHPSSPNCCSTPLRDGELPDNTDHPNFQHLYRHPDLPEQKQEDHQSQSDDVVTLIAEETDGHRALEEHISIEPQVQKSGSSNRLEDGDAIHHLEGVREQLTTSKVDNFCQGEGEANVFSLSTHSEEDGCGDRLLDAKVNEHDIRPGDAFDRVIENQDAPLESMPTVAESPPQLQECPSNNGLPSDSSLTEASFPVKPTVHEAGRFPIEPGEAMKQRFIELFKTESKKLKVAKAAYLKKKQTLRELKMLFEQGLSLSDSTLLLSVDGNSSSANSCTDATSSKSETLNDASCRSIVNSSPPSSKSSPRSRNLSRSRMLPSCKIASTPRKSNTDVIQLKSAKSTKVSNPLDVGKMYVEFIRAFERSQPRRKAFTGLVASKLPKAESPVHEIHHPTSSSRDFATTSGLQLQPSSRLPEDHACAPHTAHHCNGSSPCGTPSPPTPTHREDHPCPCVRICGLAPLCSCHAFQLSCLCNYSISGTHNTNMMPPLASHDYCHLAHHYHQRHRAQHCEPSRCARPPHSALCQEAISPHCNNSYFNAHDGLSAATNQTNCRQPPNPNEPPPATPQAKALLQSVAVERPVRESPERRQQFAPSHCPQADAGQPVPSSTLTNLSNHTHSINNGFIKVNEGGCSWFEFAPQSHSKGASTAKSTKHQSLELEEISKSIHWSPAFRDYSRDTMVRFNLSRTNPPYACDREEDFNQHNGSTGQPQSLQEAFQLRMKAFIARSEARQRFIKLNALERRLRAEQSALRSLNNCNIVFPDREMAWRARTSCLNLPDYLHCPRFLRTVGRNAYDGARTNKLKKTKRRLLAPHEAHRLVQVQKKSNLFTNRARMKQYSETIRKRLLKSIQNV